MKKKSANGLTKGTAHSHRPPVFCDPAGVEQDALGRIALRVLMSDIRKHKLGDPETPEKAARLRDDKNGGE